MTWVYTIATRHLLRRRRGRVERAVAPHEVASAIDAGLAATSPGEVPAGEVRVLEREVRLACTQRLLFALSREERIALLLVEVLGATDAVGAEICEVTRDAFRHRAAAKARLAPDTPQRRARLPVVDDARVARAQDQLRALGEIGSVFVADPPIAPPQTLWEQLAARLPDVL